MSTNNLTSELSELSKYSQGMLTAAGALTITIMLVGIIGNTLTLITFVKYKNLRTVAAAFIASLCISDLLICFFVLPFAASHFFNGKWIHGNGLCVAVPLMRYGSVAVSLLSVAKISINRYILICWRQAYASVYTNVKVCIYVASIWFISYGLQIPTLLQIWGKFGYSKKLGTCTIVPHEHHRTAKIPMFAIGFSATCVIVVICYTSIWCVVKRSRKRVQTHRRSISTSTSKQSKRTEMEITKMVLFIFISFIVCYLPLTLAKLFDEDVTLPPLHVIGYVLFYMAACINPVIYVTRNRQYRKAYFSIFKCEQ